MKLFSKYSRINVLSTVIIFLLGSVAFAFLLRYVIISQIDEDLYIEKNEILTYVRNFHQLPAIIEVHDQYTSYKVVAQPTYLRNYIHTSKRHDASEHEKELVRTIEFNVNTNSKWYLVSVSKSLEGTDNLIQTIIIITLTLILLILIATFVINRIVLNRLWQPFHNTLQAMQQFKLSQAAIPSFGNSNIEEFDLLNATLHKALYKAQQDYQVLKEFTENASHELQTPLAVIRSKLDILIQNEYLTEAESRAIQGVYDAVQHLNKLNQSLLLLAKIENRQFAEQATIALQPVLQTKINQFGEWWQSRNIKVIMNDTDSNIIGNPQLVDILLSNLISNATRHNKDNGFIHIDVHPHSVSISNASASGKLNEAALFKRFFKQSFSGDGHGLGLSIVKQICEVAAYSYTYRFEAPDVHTFTIAW